MELFKVGGDCPDRNYLFLGGAAARAPRWCVCAARCCGVAAARREVREPQREDEARALTLLLVCLVFWSDSRLCGPWLLLGRDVFAAPRAQGASAPPLRSLPLRSPPRAVGRRACAFGARAKRGVGAPLASRAPSRRRSARVPLGARVARFRSPPSPPRAPPDHRMHRRARVPAVARARGGRSRSHPTDDDGWLRNRRWCDCRRRDRRRPTVVRPPTAGGGGTTADRCTGVVVGCRPPTSLVVWRCATRAGSR